MIIRDFTTPGPMIFMDHKQQKKVSLERQQTNYIINGLRMAISSGVHRSILDQIITKDNKITEESISLFVCKFTDECAPDRRGVDEEFTKKLQRYIYDYVAVFVFYNLMDGIVLDCPVDFLVSNTDIEFLVENNSSNKVNIREYGSDYICLNTEDRGIDNLRNDLSFAHLINDYKISYPMLYPLFFDGAEELAESLRATTEDFPFKESYLELVDEFKTLVLPVLPTLITDTLIDGLDRYCDWYCLSSLRIDTTKGKLKYNDEYSQVKRLLSSVLNSIFTIREAYDKRK